MLAHQLAEYRDLPGLLVLGLPRGGVPVAYEIAGALTAELDVLIVRKLGVPYQPELAFGAIASAGATVLNDEIVAAAELSPAQVQSIIRAERSEVARREQAYRSGRGALEVRGRTVVIVDDGLATGASMRAAIAAVRTLQPAKVVAAVPVAPADSVDEFRRLADDFVCLEAPRDFHYVGWWYLAFEQTSDAEVLALLDAARIHKPSAA